MNSKPISRFAWLVMLVSVALPISWVAWQDGALHPHLKVGLPLLAVLNLGVFWLGPRRGRLQTWQVALAFPVGNYTVVALAMLFAKLDSVDNLLEKAATIAAMVLLFSWKYYLLQGIVLYGGLRLAGFGRNNGYLR